MNQYSLENFIEFCDNMQIADEKLDFRILDMNFNKSITLFHGTSEKLSVIRPTSTNVGNRLTSIRTSSFWTNNFDYAVLWALDWVAIKLRLHEYYCHDINHVLGSSYYFVLPDLYQTTKLDDGTEKEENILDVIKHELTENPVYVYQASVPTKYIGRGQCAIDEYTVDIPIKPQKEYIIDFDIASKYIKIVKDDKLYDKLLAKDSFSKDKLSIRERLIFRSPADTKHMRWKINEALR